MNVAAPQAKVAELHRRGVVAISGADAEKFLNDLVTADVPATDGTASYAALLSPQGKVLFDFLIFRNGDGFLFDLPRAAVADFIKRVTFYRLRAKVEIAEASDRRVVAAWGGAPLPGVAAEDPRLAALGRRAIVSETVGANASEADYDAHRISLGIPEGGIDFAYGEGFPHDADMDQLAGVDFKKGCYIGQEVVSRMEHRGTARRRFILARGAAPLPPPGTAVTAGTAALGTLGSSSGGTCLAHVRLDRAKEAMDAGTPILAGGAALTLALPDWAHFGWPTGAGAA